MYATRLEITARLEIPGIAHCVWVTIYVHPGLEHEAGTVRRLLIREAGRILHCHLSCTQVERCSVEIVDIKPE